MLEITRGRTWQQYHTVRDYAGGPLSDLTHLTTIKSQIRGKTAIRNSLGIFEHPLIAEVTVTSSGVTGSTILQSLTRAQTAALSPDDYLIDMVGYDANGIDEVLLVPEVVKVDNRPTVVP